MTILQGISVPLPPLNFNPAFINIEITLMFHIILINLFPITQRAVVQWLGHCAISAETRVQFSAA